MDIDTADSRAILAVAEEAANAARRPALEWFRKSSVRVGNKNDPGSPFDPVTAADRNSEEAIRDVLARRRPNDAVIGEEFGTTAGNSGLTWVVDPIDGTRSFLAGLPLWTILIGVHDGTRSIVGVIDQPYLEERYWGITTDGLIAAGCIRQGERFNLQTRRCARLADAVIGTTAPEAFATEADWQTCRRLARQCRFARYGCDAYMYAMLADGRVDLILETGLQAYDSMALAPVVNGAGGRLTDWSDGDPCWGGSSLAAGDTTLHATVLGRLANS